MKKVKRIEIYCAICKKSIFVREKECGLRKLCSRKCADRFIGLRHTKKLSEEQINFVKDNPKLSEQNLADKLKITRKTLRNFRKWYNIPLFKKSKKGCDPSKMLKGLREKYPYGTRLGSKCSIETKNKIKLHHANLSGENHPMWGKHHTEETILKLKEQHKTNPNMGMKGKHQSQEMKDKFRKKRVNWIIPQKDTTIEIKIQDFLKKMNIEFLTHYHISETSRAYQCVHC